MQQGSRFSRSSGGLRKLLPSRAFEPCAEPLTNAHCGADDIMFEAPSRARGGFSAALAARPGDDRVLASFLVMGTLAAMIAIVVAAAPTLDFSRFVQRARASESAVNKTPPASETLTPIGLSAGILAPSASEPAVPVEAAEVNDQPSATLTAKQAPERLEKARSRRANKRATRVVHHVRGAE